jgi:hypothetical protein
VFVRRVTASEARSIPICRGDADHNRGKRFPPSIRMIVWGGLLTVSHAEHLRRSTVRHGGHAIRPVNSERFGRRFVVGHTGRADPGVDARAQLSYISARKPSDRTRRRESMWACHSARRRAGSGTAWSG